MPKTAKELFEHELRDIYDAENKLVIALESMAKKCTDKKLVEGFKEHRKVTQGQIARLEQVFALVDRKPRREPCKGISGLIEEFNSFVQDENPPAEVLDVVAAAGASKVEHYEIGAYTSLIGLAETIGLTEGVKLLRQNLEEEQETLKELESSMPGLLGALEPGEIVLPVEQPTR